MSCTLFCFSRSFSSEKRGKTRYKNLFCWCILLPNFKMDNHKQIQTKGSFIEIDANNEDIPIIERHFNRYTKHDIEIQNLILPTRPIWLNIIVRLFRFYRRKISHRLGNRCVFDPSCSHYSELAFRKKGFFKGIKLTANRLYRCRASNGGIDLLS